MSLLNEINLACTAAEITSKDHALIAAGITLTQAHANAVLGLALEPAPVTAQQVAAALELGV